MKVSHLADQIQYFLLLLLLEVVEVTAETTQIKVVLTAVRVVALTTTAQAILQLEQLDRGSEVQLEKIAVHLEAAVVAVLLKLVIQTL
jgi:hypothetical protein